jgi:hypothetical protein
MLFVDTPDMVLDMALDMALDKLLGTALDSSLHLLHPLVRQL